MTEHAAVNRGMRGAAIQALPVITASGGATFFTAQATEEAIEGAVFPRGSGTGPRFQIRGGCEGEIEAWLSGPDDERIAGLALTELAAGVFETSWDWASLTGWEIPGGIPVGQYKAHVRCGADVAELPFYVVFDPAPTGAPSRFAFDGTTVWFGAGVNAAFGLHYYLHSSDRRVFGMALAAASGHTDPYSAAIAVARAEESLFGYSLNYQTNDVIDLLENYREAQCADDAACLTALLRAIGIPARPVSADAALETGSANWTFDTWVEFLAEHEGTTAWHILHPHEYPGMQPETREVFGLRGVANKGFNDLIISASGAWADGALDDGTVSLAYARNACGEPEQVVRKAPWVEELCESGYWAQSHWDCPAAGLRPVAAGKAIRLSSPSPQFGGRLGGTLELVNPFSQRQFGRLVFDLVVCRMESMAFVESVLHSVVFPLAVDPGASVLLPFDCGLPATLAPGRELCLRATFNERLVLIRSVRMPSLVAADVEMPVRWQEGGAQTVRVRIRNAGGFALRGLELRFAVPYALRLDRLGPEHYDVLAPAAVRETAMPIRALARLESGSLHVTLATANGGGLMVRKPFRIEAQG